MKKFLSTVLIALLGIVMLFSLTACGTVYDVKINIGDGSKENDDVSVCYSLDGSFKDGYVLKGYFTAEKDADLDRTFILAFTLNDRYDIRYTERVLFSVKGSAIESTKDGKVKFSITLDKLSNFFTETSGDETLKFSLVLHDEKNDAFDMTRWSESTYNYTFTDGKVTIVE